MQYKSTIKICLCYGDRNSLKESIEIINNFIHVLPVSLDKKQLLFTSTVDMNKFITVTWQLLAALLNIAAIVLFLHMLLFCQHTSVYRQVTRFPAPFIFFYRMYTEWQWMMTPTLRIAENKDRKLSVNSMHKKKHTGLTKTNCQSPFSW